MLRTILTATALMLCTMLLEPSAASGGYKLLKLDGEQVRWPAGSHGTIVSYAVNLHGSSARGRENCRTTAGIDGLLTHSQLSDADFRRSLARAFRLWSQAADVQFVPAAPGTQADIVLAAQADPDGVAYTDVRHDSSVITGAVICLNPQISWIAGQKRSHAYRLYYVLAHEIGHAIGLDHPSPEGELMSFEYSRTLQNLQPGDIAGVTALYGTARRQTADASQH